ncbi:calcium/sodium antiporter, partial [Alteromonas sp. LMIT007]|nr:calcium/sodium antiporter [Opacimonas viscosa]
TLKREFPVLLAVNIIVVYFLYDGELSSREGIILILLFIFVLAGMAWISLLVEKGDPLMSETSDEIPSEVETGKAVMWIGVGLVLLPLSAQYMVDSAVFIARYFGISDLIIGLTII